MSDHPSRDELHGYVSGHLSEEVDHLPEEAAERIREHLIHCSECATEILEFSRFSKIREEPIAPWWRPLARPYLGWLAAAASLLVALVLPLRQAQQSYRPSLNEVAIALDPPSRASRPQEIVIPARSDRFLLLWTPVEAPTSELYRLQIFSLDDRERRPWSASGLRPSPEGTFSFSLAKRFLPAGRYRLQLWPIAQPPASLLAERELRFVYR